MINSLAFLGLFYGPTQEVVAEIEEKKPLEILAKVTVPVFGGRHAAKGAPSVHLSVTNEKGVERAVQQVPLKSSPRPRKDTTK